MSKKSLILMIEFLLVFSAACGNKAHSNENAPAGNVEAQPPKNETSLQGPKLEFTYEAAAKQFSLSSVPQQDDIIGQWMLIGAAEVSHSEASSPFFLGTGYFPDGKFSAAGFSGKFGQQLAVTVNSVDVFGVKTLLALTRLEGIETRVVYEKHGPVASILTPSGMSFSVAAFAGDENATSARFTSLCRLTKTSEMPKVLLCALTFEGSGDDFDPSYKNYLGQVVGYQLYTPVVEK